MRVAQRHLQSRPAKAENSRFEGPGLAARPRTILLVGLLIGKMIGRSTCAAASFSTASVNRRPAPVSNACTVLFELAQARVQP